MTVYGKCTRALTFENFWKSVEDDGNEVQPLNLGMIAAYYYIRYTTIELFNSSLNEKTKIKGILEILTSASEFDSLPMRHGEEKALRQLAAHVPLTNSTLKYNDPHTKAFLLLQAHLSRMPVAGDLAMDQKTVLRSARAFPIPACHILSLHMAPDTHIPMNRLFSDCLLPCLPLDPARFLSIPSSLRWPSPSLPCGSQGRAAASTVDGRCPQLQRLAQARTRRHGGLPDDCPGAKRERERERERERS